MDYEQQVVEESASCKDDSGLQDDTPKSIDTSFVEMKVVGNLSLSTITDVDTEAIQTVQAAKSNEDFNISVEEDTSYDFSRIREFP